MHVVEIFDHPLYGEPEGVENPDLGLRG